MEAAKTDIQKKKSMKKFLKLYWVTNLINSEDWFVIAKSTPKAKQFYEDSEGFALADEIKVEFIIHVPKELYEKHYTPQEISPVHAKVPILKDLGFKEIASSEEYVKTFEFKGRVFREGTAMNDFFPEPSDEVLQNKEAEWEDVGDESSDEEKFSGNAKDQAKAILDAFAKSMTEKKEIKDTPGEPLKLFWVTDCLGSEDWFIIAAKDKTAAEFYSQYETLDIKAYKINAEEIMKVPNEIYKKHYKEKTPIHAQNPILKDLGFKILTSEKNITKVVEYEGRKFCEGVTQMMIDYRGNVQRIMKDVELYTKLPPILQEALKDRESMKYYSSGLYRMYRIKT